MPWRIEMLGGLTVVQGDRKITRFQTQKTGALLAYLALHPSKSHSREAIAEMLSYKSAELFGERFARRPNRNGEDPARSMADRYDIAGYLDYQGEIFTRRFDPNSYMAITKAMDNFDPAAGYESEAAALARIQARVLMVGISSDWLFPPAEVRSLTERMLACRSQCRIRRDYFRSWPRWISG